MLGINEIIIFETRVSLKSGLQNDNKAA